MNRVERERVVVDLIALTGGADGLRLALRRMVPVTTQTRYRAHLIRRKLEELEGTDRGARLALIRKGKDFQSSILRAQKKRST